MDPPGNDGSGRRRLEAPGSGSWRHRVDTPVEGARRRRVEATGDEGSGRRRSGATPRHDANTTRSAVDEPAPPALPQLDEPAGKVERTRTSDTGDPAAIAVSHAPPMLLDGNPDRYEIIDEHGRGGLGRITRAYDRSLGRTVAIKELLAPEPVREIRFLREALITARLEHPGIVPVHEAGRWPDGTPYYAMKLVAGRSLRELIASRPTVDDRIDLLHHVIAVADAIAYAHDRDIVHRDLKPANVVVGDFGETIVIDWGIAKDLSAAAEPATGDSVAHGTPDDDLTAAGSVLGTPAYMAPEQARGEPVDQRADVYAIGIMLWELCSIQRMPPADLRQRHRKLRRAGIDHDLIAIIDRAIAADPASRYPHAGALAADLKAFKSGVRIASRSYSLIAMLAHWMRRNRALAATGVAFAFAVAASVAALAVLYRASSRSAEIASQNADAADRSAASARDRLVLSYIEQGRRLMLDGDYLRALPYLSEAYTQGDRSTAVRFLLARGERLADAQLGVHSHAGRARAAAFRPDGRNILSVSEAGDAAIWDAATGQTVASLPARLPTPSGGKRFARVSRDGSFAAIGGPDGVVVWDGAATRAIATGRADRLAIHERGARIAVASPTALSAWSLATGQRLWTVPFHGPLFQLGWSGDAVFAIDDQFAAWRADGRGVAKLAADGLVYAAVAGPGGRIATISNMTLDLWDARGAHRGAIHERNRLTEVAFDAAGARIAVSEDNGVVRLYDAERVTPIGELVGHRGGINGMAFSSDGAHLVTTGVDLTVRLWDLALERQVISLRGAGDQFVLDGLRFDETGMRVVAPGTDGSVRVFAAIDPDLEASVDGGQDTEIGQFLDDGRQFATGSLVALRLWTTEDRRLVQQLPVPWNWRAIPSPNGRRAFVFNPDLRDAEIRDVASGAVMARLNGAAAFRRGAFDRAGERLVTGSDDGLVILWSLTGTRLATLTGHERTVAAVAFSPDDRRIASGGSDRTARIWDIATARELVKVTTASSVMSVELDTAGARLLTSSADRHAQLWDATTGAPLRTYENDGALQAATIDATGRLVATARTDATIDLWDATSSSLLAQFQHAALVHAVSFSPLGDRLLSTAQDQRGKLWRIGLESRPPAVVAAFVRCHAPYRLVETRLESAKPVCSDVR